MGNSDSFVCYVVKNFLLLLNLYDILMTIKQGQDVSIQYVFICLATQWFRQISLYDNINLITVEEMQIHQRLPKIIHYHASVLIVVC